MILSYIFLALFVTFIVICLMGLMFAILGFLTKVSVAAPAYTFAVLYSFTTAAPFLKQALLCLVLCGVIYLMNQYRQTAAALTAFTGVIMGFFVSLFLHMCINMVVHLPFGRDSWLLMIPTLALAIVTYAVQTGSEREYRQTNHPVLVTLVAGALWGLSGAALISLCFSASLVWQAIVLIVIGAAYCFSCLVSGTSDSDRQAAARQESIFNRN